MHTSLDAAITDVQNSACDYNDYGQLGVWKELMHTTR